MSVSIRFPLVLFALAALGLPVCAAADTIPTPVRTFVQAFVGDAGQSAVRATAVPTPIVEMHPTPARRDSAIARDGCPGR